MLDKLNMLQNSGTLNQSYETTENQKLNESSIDDFIQLNNQVRLMLENIDLNIENLEPYLQKIAQATNDQEEQRITKLFEENYQKLKNEFETIQRDQKQMEDFVNRRDQNSQEVKNNRLIIQSNYKSLQNKLTKTQKTYTEFKKAKKKRLIRLLNYTDEFQNYSEEKKEEIAEDSEQLKQIVMKEMKIRPSQKLVERAHDINEKCDGILRLQKQISELVGLIKSISEIVQAQGEQINSIHDQVVQANTYMKKGIENLQKGKEYHQDARTRMCIIIALLVCIAVILLSVILSQLNLLNYFFQILNQFLNYNV